MDVASPSAARDMAATRFGRSSTAARRRRVLALLAAGILTTPVGCASRNLSVASLNPFAKSTPTATTPEPEARLASSKTDDSAPKGTMSKLTGMFRRGDKADKIDGVVEGQPTVDPNVFVANGQLWESTGNAEKAKESYNKAIAADAKNSAALTSLARLHYREGNHAEAAKAFQKALAQNPEDAALFNDLGLTLGKLGQHDQAAATLQRALQLAPGTSRYANNLASVYYESGNPDAAFEVLRANNPAAVANFNMAFLHYKKGAVDQAKAHLQAAVADGNGGDAATRRAVDRSREMLAQLNVPVAPADLPAKPGLDQGPGAAAGPSAIIAALPSHKASGGIQAIGQTVATGLPSAAPTPLGGPAPTGFQLPAGGATAAIFKTNGVPAQAPPPAAAPAKSANPFTLPPDFSPVDE